MSQARSRRGSEALAAQAEQRAPGGVHSNVRLDGPRIFFDRGAGAWLWDVDGNDYVDYLLGQGPAFLGHVPERVLQAVERAVRGGMVFGAQHPLEIDAGERLCSMVGWAQQVRFGSSGTEMVQAALRVARAATGRRRFVRFEGHYHGWLDNVLVAVGDEGAGLASAGQLVESLEESITLPWNDLHAVEATFDRERGDIAAVLMEPVMLNAGAILPRPGYLVGVRQLCDRHGSVLIFDEVITGFRVARGGATELFGVVPDLAVYGKALGGSWPVAALAGPRELMRPLGTAEVNHSGTFNANRMAMAAVVATLELLAERSPYAELERVGSRLKDELSVLGRDVGLRVQGLPMAFHVSFGPESAELADYRSLQALDAQRYRQLAELLWDEGVWVAARGIWYLSTAHGDREVDVTLERVAAALRRL